MTEDKRNIDTIHLTSDIVAAFVSYNTVRTSELSDLIKAVHQSLLTAVAPKSSEEPIELKPAVTIKKSITDEYLVCLEDGKKFKSLKRHLAQAFGMSPEQYREKWGLPRDYPMVAPGYAAKRSQLAKESGLGDARRRGQAAQEPVVAREPDTIEAPLKKRGRPKKHLAEAA